VEEIIIVVTEEIQDPKIELLKANLSKKKKVETIKIKKQLKVLPQESETLSLKLTQKSPEASGLFQL
jgi:hypothetical protein